MAGDRGSTINERDRQITIERLQGLMREAINLNLTYRYYELVEDAVIRLFADFRPYTTDTKTKTVIRNDQTCTIKVMPEEIKVDGQELSFYYLKKYGQDIAELISEHKRNDVLRFLDLMKELTVYKVMNIMDVQTLSKAAIHDSRILFEMHKIVKPYRLARESAK
jgi:hypothetical protein